LLTEGWLEEEVAAMDAGRRYAEGLRTNLFTHRVRRSMISGLRPRARIPFAACLAMMMLFTAPLFGGNAPDLLPDTSIAPADTSSSPATPPPARHTTAPHATEPSNEEGSEAAAPPPVPIVHHHATPRPNATPIPNLVYEVEPAEARVLLHNDTTAYLQPSKMSPVVEQLQAGKFIHVSGATHYFLQTKLKNGSFAYVPSDDAYLTVPADKIFRLTSDTPVLERPNKWAKQLAMVHQGHDVHVVGVALSYMKIQMKSGLEGYITTRALE
jgi:hypothetical protein